MTGEIRVRASRAFRQDVKQLRKKYRHLEDDVKILQTSLEQGERPGVQIENTDTLIFKVRLRNSDLQRGKSGGYRVIYYIHTPSFIALLRMFSKTEESDIPLNIIFDTLDDFLDELDSEDL